jgi:hypothetical protein
MFFPSAVVSIAPVRCHGGGLGAADDMMWQGDMTLSYLPGWGRPKRRADRLPASGIATRMPTA